MFRISNLFHGTVLEGKPFQLFDPQTTGKGNDEVCSGYYFARDEVTAAGYSHCTPDQSARGYKGYLYECTVTLKNPLIWQYAPDNNIEGRLIDIDFGDFVRMLQCAPDIFDEENSPLLNFDDIQGMSPRQKEALLHRVAKSYHYPGFLLNTVETDFFRHHSESFREAVRGFTGYDGVIYSMEGFVNVIAWFPDQIEINEIRCRS